MKKFTFKTSKSTGRYKSFYNNHYYILLNKCIVGQFSDSLPCKIRLMVIKTDEINDNNPNCDWMWIGLKMEFATIDAAKVWLNDNFELINTRYKFKS